MPSVMLPTISNVRMARVIPDKMWLLIVSMTELISGTPGIIKSVQQTSTYTSDPSSINV